MSCQSDGFEPYQPYFLSGLLCGLIGVGFWIFQVFGLIPYFPLQSHSNVMVMGFFMSFITGFLMTAVPKMTGTERASLTEILFGLVLIWLQVAMNIRNQSLVSDALGLAQFLLLIFFVGKRAWSARSRLPRQLVMVPFALFFGGISFVLRLASHFSVMNLNAELKLLVQYFIYEVFVLLLIVGLGSRLVPGVSRVQSGFPGAMQNPPRYAFAFDIGLLILLVATYCIQVFYSLPLGAFIRFVLLSWIAIDRFKLLEGFMQKGNLGVALKASTFFILLSPLLIAIFPSYELHFRHLSFIAGMGLLTILIAVRVVVAHGGFDLTYEIKSTPILAFSVLLILAALLRVLSGVFLPFRDYLIVSAAMSWILATAIWMRGLLSMLLKSEKAEACLK